MQPASFPWFSLVPILCIVGGLVVCAVAIVTDHRRKQALLAERRLMIEKGMTPPPPGSELFSGEHAAGSSADVESSLRQGIIVLFTGLGLCAAFLVLRYFVGPEGTFIPARAAALLGPVGALVAMIGVGYLVYYRLARNRPTSPGM
jgi:ABC-type uncharacterized transport system permease subunit